MSNDEIGDRRQQQLFDALEAYVGKLQSGARPERPELLAHEPELGRLLDCLDRLHELAQGGTADFGATRSWSGPGTWTSVVAPFGKIDRYELLGELDPGGMGVVFKARQTDLDRTVALKMIRAGPMAAPEQVRRFHAEVQTASRIQHPNIVKIYDAGQVAGMPYFTMEYVEGASLRKLAGARPIDSEEAARLVAIVARAVAHLHSLPRPIIHRDLKPANILVDAAGQPYLTDFGLAKLLSDDEGTQSSVIAGTASYMAPEQAAGRPIGPFTDIYGLGAVLYELLAGRPPFREASTLDTLVQVLEGEPLPPRKLNPSVPADLETICLKCLEKAPEKRYASAAALADDLERFRRRESIAARPLGYARRLVHWSRRKPALVSRLAALGLYFGVEQAWYYGLQIHTPDYYLTVSLLVVLWMASSGAFQWLMDRQSRPNVARFGWAAADAYFLTAILLSANSVSSPMVIGYPLLIAAAGLWFRVALVYFMTAISLAAYAVLIVQSNRERPDLARPFDHHVIVLIALAVTGIVVAYQVHRVRVLSRYYERRTLP